MSKKKLNRRSPATPYFHENHKRPMTRREFISQGFLAGSAMVMGPSLLGLFGHTPDAIAAAAECGIATGGAGKIPFVCFDLNGGGNIAGSNVMVGGKGYLNEPLTEAGYRKLGMTKKMIDDGFDSSLGLAFQKNSPFLGGIIDTTSAETRANTNGAVICAQSANDTPNNPHNPMYGIYKAGASGNLVPLIGTRSSVSGGNSIAPASMIDVKVMPTKIASENDARGLVDTGKLATLLNGSSSGIVMDTIQRISALKLNKITEAQAIKTFLDCGYQQSADQVASFSDPASLDPTKDANITSIPGFGLSNGSFANADIKKTAAVMKLVIEGYAGAGTVEMGGFDYHNKSRSDTDNKDRAAGQAVGAVLEYAKKNNKPVMVYVFTDGSVSTNGSIDSSGKFVWTTDEDTTASVFFLVYNPNGRPILKNSAASQQIGYFRPNGSVETSATPASNNVTQLAQTIVLNYMALHNETGQFDKVIPDQGLGLPTDWDKLVAFEPIV